MIISFKDQGNENIFNGKSTKEARQACPNQLWGLARRKLDMLDAAVLIKDLLSPPGNRLEKLKGDRSGQHSIRINDQFRICFIWIKGAEEVEITNYHT